MSIYLIIYFSLLFGLLNTQQRHAGNFHGESMAYANALTYSGIIGTLVTFGLLVYYGIQTSWYLPIGLLFIGSIIGGLLFGVLDHFVQVIWLSVISFSWPIPAYLMYTIIKNF